jgi:hypothetical protein
VLDTAAFDKCLDSGEHAAAVAKDASEAQRLQLTGTLTFFINGQLFDGPLAFQAMRSAINKEQPEASHKETGAASGLRLLRLPSSTGQRLSTLARRSRQWQPISPLPEAPNGGFRASYAELGGVMGSRFRFDGLRKSGQHPRLGGSVLG